MNDTFYYKYVDIHNYDDIVSELTPCVLKHLKQLKFGFNFIETAILIDNSPLLKQWLIYSELLSQVRERTGIIIVKPFHNNDIHVDTISNNKNYSTMALNMEIQNCRIPKTKMFTTDTKPYIKLTDSKLEYLAYGEDTVFNEVTEFDLSRAVFFNTQVPHQVCNSTDTPRISCSFRFYKDPIL